jgi:predicted pyridoxine 5'-phosphate oxidase superfamily flavin-nucleotide-binding protein
MAHAYHPGERRRQDRAGVRAIADVHAGGIDDSLTPAAAAFLAAQPLVVVGHRTSSGAVWASILHGAPGFVRATDDRTVTIDARPRDGDALGTSLAATDTDLPIGLLAIEPARRLRLRLNGRGRSDERGRLVVRAEEVYGNCPKYISTRTPEPSANLPGAPHSGSPQRATHLLAEQRALVAAADTFFVASAHATSGADVSHRGGRPGFVLVDDAGSRLTWPDYRGNAMFMTLGNLEIDPAAGLAFPDWLSGDVLQVRGRAVVDDDPVRAAAFPGAERLVDLDVEEVVTVPGGLGSPWRFGAPSKVSPPAPGSR